MRYVFSFLNAALLGLALVAAPVAAGAASPADENLAKKVEHQLMIDKSFDATSVIVDATDGVIHLRGTVKNKATGAKVENVAKGVGGVKSVQTQFDYTSEQGNQ